MATASAAPLPRITRLLWRGGRAAALTAVLTGVPGWGVLAAQAIPRPDYVSFLPRGVMRPVSQTEASVRFRLFGDDADPGYTDLAPRNGIDDRRDRLFRALGEAFAPWMVRNAYGFPTDIQRLIRERGTPLVRDRFNLARHDPELTETDTLFLGPGPSAPCTGDSSAADCRLGALLERLGPQAEPVPPLVRPDQDLEEVLYFDFPGEDPKSWAREYGTSGGFHVNSRYLGYAKAYVHPFLAEVGAESDGGARYELVLQYWFFYPTNDAGNIHEGDFEHLSVVIAPRQTVAEPLDSAGVEAVLAGRVELEDLVIRRVEYYFHHWVFPVDYSTPNVYQPRDQWKEEVERLEAQRIGAPEIWGEIRDRAWLDDAETRINRHPLVMIGGDGRGLGLLLKPPGSLGLSSHGSYPFAGLYKAVGPAGTGESVDHPGNLHRDPPPADAPESEPMIRYDLASRIEVLPDWERVAPLALAESAVRWDWAWFLLPAYVGYPATKSPLAGVVRHADTGNVPPGPPIYNGGWNRLGDGAGYAPYVPHRVSGLFPFDVQDTYNARWGYLNATAPTLSLLPPFDVISRVVSRPIRALIGHDLPMYSRSQDLPARRIGVGMSVTRFVPSDDFWLLAGFPEIATPLIQYGNAKTGTPLLGYGLGPAKFDAVVTWRGEIDLYLGNHFITTNSLVHGRSRMRQQMLFSSFPPDPIRADLNFWEYSGSLRLNLTTRRVQPFVYAGYGLSWYRLENYQIADSTIGDTRWVRKPGLFDNLLPNTWHFGAGVEVLPSYGFGRLNLGIKASAALYLHDLGLSTGNATTVFFQNTGIERWMLSLGGTIAY